MTDQNNLARKAGGENQNEDPLEELARIVSGGLDFDAERKRRSAAAAPTRVARREEPVKTELQESPDENPAASSAASQVTEDIGFDLEAELMRELGAETDSNSDVESQPVAEDESKEGDDIGEFGQFDHPVQTGSAMTEKPADAADAQAAPSSLEDQLMAELGQQDSPAEKHSATGKAAAEAAQPSTEQAATPPLINRRDTSFGNVPPRRPVENLQASVQSAKSEVREPATNQNTPPAVAEPPARTGNVVPIGHVAKVHDVERLRAEKISALAVEERWEETEALPEPDVAADHDGDIDDFDFTEAFEDEIRQANVQPTTPVETRKASLAVAKTLTEIRNRALDSGKSAADTVEPKPQRTVSVSPAVPPVPYMTRVEKAPPPPQPAAPVASIAQPPRQPENPTRPIDAEFDMGAAFEAELSQLGHQGANPPKVVASIQPAAGRLTSVTSRAEQIPTKAELNDEFARAFAKELDLGDLAKTNGNASKPVQTAQKSQLFRHQWKEEASQTNVSSYRETDRPADHEPSYGDGEVEQMRYPEDVNQGDQTEIHSDEFEEFDETMLMQPTGRSKGFKLAMGALVLAIVIGGGAVAYNIMDFSPAITEPVTIKADTEPVKVKPDDPGGTMVANQDKAAYERVTGNFATDTRQETLVKSAETPVVVPGREEQASAAAAPATEQTPPSKEEERLSPSQEGGTPSAATALLEPRRVRTMTVKPDGTIIAAPPPAAQESVADDNKTIGGARSTGAIAIPSPRPSGSGASDPAPVAAAAAPSDIAPIPLAATSEPPSAPAAPEPVAEKVANAAATTASDAQIETLRSTADVGSWAVQISSQRSAEDAQTTFQKMKDQYSSVLGTRQMAIQRAEVEGKGVYYRVRVLAQTRDEAIKICTDLKAAGGSCFVTQ